MLAPGATTPTVSRAKCPAGTVGIVAAFVARQCNLPVICCMQSAACVVVQQMAGEWLPWGALLVHCCAPLSAVSAAQQMAVLQLGRFIDVQQLL